MTADDPILDSFNEALKSLKEPKASSIKDRLAVMDGIIPPDSLYANNPRDNSIRDFFDTKYSPLIKQLKERLQTTETISQDEVDTMFLPPFFAALNLKREIPQINKAMIMAQLSLPPAPVISEIPAEMVALQKVSFLLEYHKKGKFSSEEVINEAHAAVEKAKSQLGAGYGFGPAFKNLELILQMANDQISEGQGVSPKTIERIEKAVEEGLNPPPTTRASPLQGRNIQGPSR